jgi:transposase-like protein
LRTEPLKGMVVGAFVRGLSMRHVESLCEEAGLGKLSKSAAARICTELRERFVAFGRRDLYDIRLVTLFLDAIYLPVRPHGPKEGMLCAWGFTENGERALAALSVPRVIQKRSRACPSGPRAGRSPSPSGGASTDGNGGRAASSSGT